MTYHLRRRGRSSIHGGSLKVNVVAHIINGLWRGTAGSSGSVADRFFLQMRRGKAGYRVPNSPLRVIVIGSPFARRAELRCLPVRMQSVEIRAAVNAKDDGLAVDDELPLLVFHGGLDNPGERLCPVVIARPLVIRRTRSPSRSRRRR